MTNYYRLTLLSLLLTNPLFAQTFTQDAKSKSTLLFHGSYIGVNITDAQLGLGISNLNTGVAKNFRVLVGGELKADNQTGIGDLFSAGSPNANVNARGFFGLSISNAENVREELKRDSDIEFYETRGKSINDEYVKRTQAYLNASYANIENHETMETIKAELDPILKKYGTAFLQKIVENLTDNPVIIEFKKKLKKDTEDTANSYILKRQKIEDFIRKINASDANKSFIKFTPFITGGIRATTINYIDSLSALSSVGRSPLKDDFRGGQLGVGFNIQWRQFVLGGIYNYLETNNADFLVPKEYTQRRTITNGNNAYITEKKVTVYEGNYSKVYVREINLDLLCYFPLTNQFVMPVNVYYRHTLSSNQPERYPTIKSVGMGLYLFKSNKNFLGGLYFELPDTTNEVEKLNPSPELKTAIKRFTFGITTRFALNSSFSDIKL